MGEDETVLEYEIAEPVLGEQGAVVVLAHPRRGLRLDLAGLDIDRPDLRGRCRVAAGVVLSHRDVENTLAADAMAGRSRNDDVLERDLLLLLALVLADQLIGTNLVLTDDDDAI